MMAEKQFCRPLNALMAEFIGKLGETPASELSIILQASENALQAKSLNKEKSKPAEPIIIYDNEEDLVAGRDETNSSGGSTL